MSKGLRNSSGAKLPLGRSQVSRASAVGISQGIAAPATTEHWWLDWWQVPVAGCWDIATRLSMLWLTSSGAISKPGKAKAIIRRTTSRPKVARANRNNRRHSATADIVTKSRLPAGVRGHIERRSRSRLRSVAARPPACFRIANDGHVRRSEPP